VWRVDQGMVDRDERGTDDREGVAAAPAAAGEPVPGGRCFGGGDPLMAAYHDHEWGRPVVGEAALFERLALEAFQAGLSWRVVLGKREAFREVFHGFRPELVAGFGPDDVERLVGDVRIVRNRAKIEAVIAGARATLALQEAGDSLAALVARHAPAEPGPAPATWEDVPGSSPESAALARDLKRCGFRFVGPTTAYATMQAIGLVNDHLATCPARAGAGWGRPVASGVPDRVTGATAGASTWSPRETG
jgi:DNA-3-methyladenine glycosylase I